VRPNADITAVVPTGRGETGRTALRRALRHPDRPGLAGSDHLEQAPAWSLPASSRRPSAFADTYVESPINGGSPLAARVPAKRIFITNTKNHAIRLYPLASGST